MYFVTTKPTTATAARRVARTAQKKIKSETGMNMSVMLPTMENMTKTPLRMLHVIALALDMSPDAYKMKTRIRNIAEMRFLGALFLRHNYPTLTLQQIALYFGGQDHTSIMNGLSKAYTLIEAGDSRFVQKYNSALKSVNKWLRGGE